MKKILVLLTLFQSLSFILAQCPDTPISSATTYECTTPQKIALSSLPNFPSPDFTVLGVSFTAKVTDLCSATKYSYLSLAIGTENMFYFSNQQDSLKATILGVPNNLATLTQTDAWVSVFIWLSLSGAGNVLLSDVATSSGSIGTLMGNRGSTSSTFGQDTTIYLCSDNSAASATDVTTCIISELSIYYSIPRSDMTGFSGSFKPTLAAFYPLIDGPATTLWDTVKTTSSGYLGDSASSPVSESVPTWDSSNQFISITSQTQFLTFPMPTYAAGESSILLSFTLSAWIKVDSVGGGTILSILSSDGASKKLTLTVNSNGLPTIKAGGYSTGLDPYNINLSFGIWHLVGLNIKVTPGSTWIAGSVSVDGSYDGFSSSFSNTYAFASGDILRIGDSASSFTGSVSVVRIMTPGSSMVRGSASICSSTASLELGAGSFALKCDANSALYDSDNKCYDISSCPAGSSAMTTEAGQNFCLSSLPGTHPGGSGNTGGSSGGSGNPGSNTGGNGNTEANQSTGAIESSSDGLSGGAIAGIVVGSIAGVVLVGGGALYLKARRKRMSRKSYSIPEPTTVMTTSP